MRKQIIERQKEISAKWMPLDQKIMLDDIRSVSIHPNSHIDKTTIIKENRIHACGSIEMHVCQI